MLHSEPEQTATLLGVPRGQERDLETWKICECVCDMLESYRPLGFPVAPLRVAELTADSLEDDQATHLLFSEWRAMVTAREATNAARLTVLITCLRDLTALRLRAADDASRARIDELLEPIARLVERVWQVDVPPARENLRVWAPYVCARFDLLPRHVRRL